MATNPIIVRMVKRQEQEKADYEKALKEQQEFVNNFPEGVDATALPGYPTLPEKPSEAPSYAPASDFLSNLKLRVERRKAAQQDLQSQMRAMGTPSTPQNVQAFSTPKTMERNTPRDTDTAERNVKQPQFVQPVYLLDQIGTDYKATKPVTPKELRTYNKARNKDEWNQSSRLAMDILQGKASVANYKPEEIPWADLLSLNMGGKEGFTEVANIGFRDPAKGYEYLKQLQEKTFGTAEEKQSMSAPSFTEGLKRGWQTGVALGVPEQAAGRTTAEKAGQFTGNVLGMIPSTVVAAGTGGTAAAKLLTKLVPKLAKGGKIAQVAIGAAQGLGTGAVLAPAQETYRAIQDGELNAGEAAKRAAGTIGTYAAFGGAYPVASSIVGAAGKQIAQRAPGLASAAKAVGERAPVAAAVAEGVPAGAIAGAMVGILQGAGKAVMDEDARDFVPFVQYVAQSAKEEMGEELVEAIAYGISRGLVKPTPGAVQTAAQALKETAAEVEQELAPSAEATPVQTNQAEETPTPAANEAPAASQVAIQAPSKQQVRSEMVRTANPGMDEGAIVSLVRDTDNLTDAEFTDFVGRMNTPAKVDTNQRTETAPEPAVEVEGEPVLSSQVYKKVEIPKTFGDTVKVGDAVAIEGRTGSYEVVDTSDPSLLQVRTESGAEMPVGRKAVKPVDVATSVAQEASQVEPQATTTAQATPQVETPPQQMTSTRTEATVPPASMAEVNKPKTEAWLKQRAEQEAKKIGTTLEKFTQNPNGWKGILTNPISPLHRYWLQAKMKAMGKPLPQNVSDLMIELDSTIAHTNTNRDEEIRRVQDELTVAVENALKDEKTLVERLLAGEEPIPLTGRKALVEATETKVEPQATQQDNLFDQSGTDQLSSYREELAGVQKEKAETQAKWDTMVEEVATKMAKEASKSIEEVRKSFWKSIKEHGYIRSSDVNKEDFHLPTTLNHLKRKDGVPLDVLATDMGYESEDAFVDDILAFADMTAESPSQHRAEAESTVEGSTEGAELKALLDYYREAEGAVQTAMAEQEGGTHGETGEAEADQGADRGEYHRVDTEGTVGRGGEADRGLADGGGTAEGTGAARTVAEGKRRQVNRQTQGFSGERPSIPRSASQPLPTVKRREIVKFLESRFGKMKTGGVRGKGILGRFNKATKVIRTRLAEDFPIQMHEVGHKLDQELGLSMPRYDRELIALGKKTTPVSMQKDTEYRRAEGVAEFLRLYLMDPASAQTQAPEYYAAFEAKMTANPDVADSLKIAQEMVRAYVSQNPRDKLLSVISVGEKGAGLPNTPTRIYARTVDQLAPLAKVVKDLGVWGKLKVDQNPYLQGVLARGWAGKPKTWIERGVTDDNFDFISEPLNKILGDVDSLDDFRAYVVAKRAKELMTKRGFTVEQTLGVGVSPEEVDSVIAQFEPKYGGIQKRLVTFQNYMIDELVKSGVVSTEGAAAMKNLNEDYVPFFRYFDENLGTFAVAGAAKFANVGNPIKRIKGSGRTIIDPIESVVKNTYLLLNVATRNKVGRTFIEFVETNGKAGELAEKVTSPMQPVNFHLGDIKQDLEQAGLFVDTADLEKVATVFTPTGRPNASRYQLTIMRDGKREYWEVDPEIYRSLLFLDEESTATWVKILGTPASVLRAGAVLSPEFLGSNPVRDQWTAFVNSEYGYVPGVDLVRGTFDAIGKSDLYYKWQASGGAQASLVSLDRKSLQKQIRGYMDDLKLQKESIPAKTLHVLKKVPNLVEWVEALRSLSETSETATRMGEFRRGVQKEGATREGYQRAALAARDVTVDFSRRGSQTQTLNRLTAFFNAQLQGLDKTARVFKQAPLRTTVRSTLVFTLPTILLYAMNRDNPYWEEKDQWQKDLFFLLPIPGTEDANGHAQHFLYLPKGHALAMVFGSSVERVLRWIDKEDPTAFDGLGQQLSSSFLPAAPIPTAVMPLIENMANYDFFTDMPVVPLREQKLDAVDQYNIYTSDTARVLAKYADKLAGVGISPRKVDNLISGYGGGLGKLLVGEGGGTVARGVEKAVEGESGAVARPSRGWASVPFVKAFARDAAGMGTGSSVDQFYKGLEKAESVNARLKRAKDSGSSYELSDDEAAALGSLKGLRKIDGELQDLRAMRRMVENNKDLTGDEKREIINALELQMTNMARAVLGKSPIETEE